MKRITLKTIAIAIVACALILPGTALALQNRGGNNVACPVMQGEACPMHQDSCEACPNATDPACEACPNAAGLACEACPNVSDPACEACPNYIDANGDATCDNASSCAAAESCPGQGANFIDTDNNGVCDNYDAGSCPGNGQGNGQAQGNGNGCGYGNGHGAMKGNGCGQGNGACRAA